MNSATVDDLPDVTGLSVKNLLRLEASIVSATKSHDVTDAEGRRIQVKAMGRRMAGRAAKFSPFRSFDFDTAVFLLFASDTFELSLAVR